VGLHHRGARGRRRQLIAGHGRVLAAKKSKLQEIPVMVARIVRCAEAGYLFADNKLGLNSDWGFGFAGRGADRAQVRGLRS
jgi:hypothetical protein